MILSDGETDNDEYEEQDSDEEDRVLTPLPEEEDLPDPEKLLDELLGDSTAFEKLQDYGKFLSEENPWHPSLQRKLFPSQIIGYHWMLDRHKAGGGLVADKVGCGKVCFLSLLNTVSCYQGQNVFSAPCFTDSRLM